MAKVTITFELETPLTGIEIECLAAQLVEQLIDKYFAGNITVTQDG